jgi:hypothetical protein
VKPVKDQDLEILPVEHQPEYVIGYPVHVAITVRAKPNTAFRLAFADITDLRECIGIEMIGDSARIREMPEPIPDPEASHQAWELGPGESHRMLADVSPLIGADIQEGEYRVRFTYLSPGIANPSIPVVMRFRRPARPEEEFKRIVAADRPAFPNWAMWSLACGERPIDAAQVKAGPLVFSLAVRHLLCGKGPLNTVDPAVLDVLGGLYAPERDALKAELYDARGDRANYERLRARIASDAPGLEWWVRIIDEGGAYLKTFSRRRSDVGNP